MINNLLNTIILASSSDSVRIVMYTTVAAFVLIPLIIKQSSVRSGKRRAQQADKKLEMERLRLEQEKLRLEEEKMKMQSQKRICEYCLRENSYDSAFCESCGARLNTNDNNS